jgi:hypothetical protein
MARNTRSKPTRKRNTARTPEHEPWTPWGKWQKARQERRERRRQAREARRIARQQARIRRRRRLQLLTLRPLVFVLLLLLSCSVGLIVQLVIGPPFPWVAIRDTARTVHVAQELESRQARWQSLALNHYTVEFEYIDNAGVWCGPGQIEVQDGRVVRVPDRADTHWTPPAECSRLVRQLTPDNAFGWLRGHLREYVPGQTVLNAQFNGEFGYLTWAAQSTHREETPGCCWEVTWQNVRPVLDD